MMNALGQCFLGSCLIKPKSWETKSQREPRPSKHIPQHEHLYSQTNTAAYRLPAAVSMTVQVTALGPPWQYESSNQGG